MHGRVKVRTTAEQEAIKKIERAKKVEQYRAVTSLIYKKREEGTYDEELLVLIEKMVLQNPDIYTLWNIRREAFEQSNWSDEELKSLLEKELILTQNCLRENPKSYSVWHHRCWVNEKLKEPDWKTELNLCAKCLELDERNFHCWDYRRYVVEKAGISDEEEFEFSTEKINKNFSNYSSWHYRSKILSKLFPDESGKLPIKEDKHKEELDLVMNATFTDPNDSSAWFYQRWLLDIPQVPNRKIWRAVISETSLIVIFNNDIDIDSIDLKIISNGVERQAKWRSANGLKFSKVWTTPFQYSNEQIQLIVEDTYNFSSSQDSKVPFYKSELLYETKTNDAQLKDQMENYASLIKMEPNNKWALITEIFLMKNIDFVKHYDKILEDLEDLKKIDKLRANYYMDLRSKYLIEYNLQKLWKGEPENAISLTASLTNLGITCLSNEHYFAIFEEVDLNGNSLGHSLNRLRFLQNCKRLSLSNNGLKSLRGFPVLEKLEELSLNDNELTNLQEICDLVESHNLKKLELKNNPVSGDNALVEKIAGVSKNLRLIFQ